MRDFLERLIYLDFGYDNLLQKARDFNIRDGLNKLNVAELIPFPNLTLPPVKPVDPTLPPEPIEPEVPEEKLGMLRAGEDVTYLDLVYLKDDGRWWKGGAANIEIAELVGLVMETKLTGERVRVMLNGVVEHPSWSWTPGQPIFLSVMGGLTQTRPEGSGEVVAKVAWPLTPFRILFCPDNTRIELK